MVPIERSTFFLSQLSSFGWKRSDLFESRLATHTMTIHALGVNSRRNPSGGCDASTREELQPIASY
jgi:hypothetical protein